MMQNIEDYEISDLIIKKKKKKWPNSIEGGSPNHINHKNHTKIARKMA